MWWGLVGFGAFRALGVGVEVCEIILGFMKGLFGLLPSLHTEHTTRYKCRAEGQQSQGSLFSAKLSNVKIQKRRGARP